MRRDHVREDRMRLFRSVLTQEMFGASRFRAIQFAFGAWLMWWRGRVGTKAAFKLRQGLIAHDLNLRRSKGEMEEARLRPPAKGGKR